MCILGLQQSVYPWYMYSMIHTLKTATHNVYPGSKAVCIPRVHVFNDAEPKICIQGQQKFVYPGYKN